MGRPKGALNKSTTLLKEAILLAAEQAGNGSLVEYLAAQAVASPNSFLSLLGKVLPSQVDANVEGGITITVATHVPRD